MRVFLDAHPEFTAEDALRMATTAPAAFLDMGGRLGVLAPGAKADLIAVPSADVKGGSCPVVEACANVIAHDGEVPWVMIGGRVVRRP